MTPGPSGSSRQLLEAVSTDDNVEDDTAEPSGSVPKHEVDLKLDPKAGCRIEVSTNQVMLSNIHVLNVVKELTCPDRIP